MTFTVDWTASAAAGVWSLIMANYPLRAGIVDAIDHGIPQELGTDAHMKGYAMDNCRVVRVGPLTVLFTVSMTNRFVEVVWVYITAAP